MKTLLHTYVNYNLWANKKIADLLIKIDPALLKKEIKSSLKEIDQEKSALKILELTET